MTSEDFSAGNWIDRLARALPNLAEVQEPYLQESSRQNPRVHDRREGKTFTSATVEHTGMPPFSRQSAAVFTCRAPPLGGRSHPIIHPCGKPLEPIKRQSWPMSCARAVDGRGVDSFWQTVSSMGLKSRLETTSRSRPLIKIPATSAARRSISSFDTPTANYNGSGRQRHNPASPCGRLDDSNHAATPPRRSNFT